MYTLQLQSWVLKQSTGRVMHRAQVFMVKILPCGFVIHKNCNRKNDTMISSHWNNLYESSESNEKAASWLVLVFFVMCTAQGCGEEFTEANNDHIVKTTGNESRSFVNPLNHSDLTWNA